MGVPLPRQRQPLEAAVGGRIRDSRTGERALRRELERPRPGRQMTLAELVEGYLQVHQAAPATIEKLRWLLAKATVVFGEARLVELRAGRDLCLARRAT